MTFSFAEPPFVFFANFIYRVMILPSYGGFDFLGHHRYFFKRHAVNGVENKYLVFVVV